MKFCKQHPLYVDGLCPLCREASAAGTKPDALISNLKAVDGVWYLATPYSNYPAGTEKAFVDACKVASWFVRQKIPVYCPISHTHPIAVHGGLDVKDHDIWLPADRPFMDLAAGIAVCHMETWDQSYGIAHEIDVFTGAGKPVVHLPWPIQ